MNIIDAHAHISESEYGNIKLYLQQLKVAGVKQGIVCPGGMMDVRKMTDYIIGRAQPENPKPNNAYIEQSCKKHAKVIKGFACIDPHAQNAMSDLQTRLQTGFCGLKLSPMTHQFSFASKAIATLVECCESFHVPVYTHVVFSPGASTARFVALAKQFPRVNFILGHMGFGPADQEGLEAARTLNNFFLETSTGNYLHIEQAVKSAGPDKVIFGSEFPLSHPKAELEKIMLLKITDVEREKILGGNISNLLGLE